MDRRDFIKTLTAATAVTAVAATGCSPDERPGQSEEAARGPIPAGRMTYRTCPTSGDRVSLLGFGAMRLPTLYKDGINEQISQKRVNELVDTAMAHGVNYYDTSPAYCRGLSESSLGEALARHDRSKYYIATKLSNFDPSTWSREASIRMYKQSFRNLRTDHIDYMLLHAIGISDDQNDGMQQYRKRYEDNGMLDYLIDERAAGRIRNLGFSYHGDIRVFDYLLSIHSRVHWDFVQIQLNYVDWHYAKQVDPRNTNAEELYGKLQALGIPAVIMEPLLGGRLASLTPGLNAELQALRPRQSVASWAFRFAGSLPGVLTVLSGMTYMEHLEDNLRTYSPLEPCTDDELRLLERVAGLYIKYPLVPCTQCKYCMPCPYGLDIPTIFTHYNKMVNNGNVAVSELDPDYARARREFLVRYARAVVPERQADHCTGCRECVKHCPQRIDIPAEMQKIDSYVESLKRSSE